MDRKEIKEAAALFNTVKTTVEEVEAPVSFLNEAEEVITVELDKTPRDKKGLEEWEKAAPVKVYEAVNAIESVRIGDGDIRAIDDSMLAEYLPELVKTLYMEVKAATAPPAEEKAVKAKKKKKEKVEKPVKDKDEKVKKSTKEKVEVAKTTKIEAICQALKIGGTMDTITSKANEIYIKNGGKDNLPGTIQYANIITSALKCLDLITKGSNDEFHLQ